MNFARLTRHIFMPRRSLRRSFDEAALNAIEKAITDTEKTHGGEVRIALEASLDPAELFSDITPRQRALQAFSHLGVWDTELNNGVLIYVLWADRDVEIVADRGFNGRISAQEWSDVCHRMEQLFSQGSAASAMIAGIQAAGALISRHFPAADRNELPDRPTLL
ncbi:TPM domain-containing protein [Steroidobacter agaridevorans]|uniref:TPM domain-containing protein n=1 Tax=Steroidobacter agaridevorans TaxID=2695856 RepID=UPI001327C79C|nr:TPM domain-containing protein [Steroidobacter agaridevorans]GFE88772.1 membrane protein [Steroidobacter agaridevorans]